MIPRTNQITHNQCGLSQRAGEIYRYSGSPHPINIGTKNLNYNNWVSISWRIHMMTMAENHHTLETDYGIIKKLLHVLDEKITICYTTP